MVIFIWCVASWACLQWSFHIGFGEQALGHLFQANDGKILKKEGNKNIWNIFYKKKKKKKKKKHLGDNCIQNFHLGMYIVGYSVAKLWRYPIRRHVAFASALEFVLVWKTEEH